MLDIINDLWYLKRDIVSDGFDQALEHLRQIISAAGLQMQVHEYPTGETCWTWRVPEKWTCQEAYLETLDGKRLIDYADHPLHVVSYSLPFEGVISRQELLKHLHVHPRLPDAIPFGFKYYDRDWGLCTTQNLRDYLQDEAYRVVIRTAFEPGTLKVGEVVLPGQSPQSIVLVAHLCHPAMVNDDLSGVVVGVDVMRKLAEQNEPLYYTYRLLILPETIGSVAYLSHNESLIPSMVGGLFL
jgi:aminopeptidase-like protein